MNHQISRPNRNAPDLKGGWNRRQFLGGALTAAASASSLRAVAELAAQNPPPEPKPAAFERRLKLGVIGNGGRGAWIAKLFQKHGGYEMHAVDGVLTTILSREATMRRVQLVMEEVLRENRRLELDLKGLKA